MAKTTITLTFTVDTELPVYEDQYEQMLGWQVEGSDGLLRPRVIFDVGAFEGETLIIPDDNLPAYGISSNHTDIEALRVDYATRMNELVAEIVKDSHESTALGIFASAIALATAPEGSILAVRVGELADDWDANEGDDELDQIEADDKHGVAFDHNRAIDGLDQIEAV